MKTRKIAASLIAAATLFAAGVVGMTTANAADIPYPSAQSAANSTLIAQYNFDSTDMLADGSGNNAGDLAVFNGAKAEKYGDTNSNALSVRGNGQYAETPSGLFSTVTDSMSFTFRAKTRSVEEGDAAVTIGNGSNKYVVLRLQGTKVTVAATQTGAAGETAAQVSKDSGTPSWTYYTVSWVNGLLKLYLNGVQSGQVKTSFKPSDFGDMDQLKGHIGKSFDDSTGSIDAGFDDMSFYAGGTPVATTDIGVDLNQSTGTVMHGATGFLYGIADDGVPTDTMLQGLGHLYTQVGRPTDGKQHPNGDSVETADQWFRNGGQDIQIYLKDMYPIPWPYPAYSPNIEEDYLPKIKQQMDSAKKAGLDTSKVILITFNEPDLGDQNYRGSSNPTSAGFQRLISDWDTMYDYIKKYNADNKTDFKVGGPNYNFFYESAYDAFLKHTVEHNTVPDVVTWHELSGDEARGFLPHYNSWKAMEAKYLGADSDIPVSINEYATKGTPQVTPGTLVQYISHFENAKVSAALPYWYPSGDLDWLTTHNNQAIGSWWLYNWYGQLSGNTVNVSLKDENQTTQAVASYDQSTRQTKVLFGGADTGAIALSSVLKFSGATDKYPNGAHVTVFGVDPTAPGNDPAAGNKTPEASKGTYVQWQGDATAAQLSAGVEIPDLEPGSAYYAVITPGQTGGTTANQSDGVYEAEYTHVADKNNDVSKTLTIGYGAGAYGAGYVTGFENVKAADGDAVKFFVTSEKDGYYDVKVRYSATKSSKLALKINRQSTLTLNLPSTQGKWGEAVVRSYLPLGISELELTAPETAPADAAGVRVDDVKLAAADDSAVQRIEAEADGNSFAGRASVFDDAQASGGKAVNYVGNNAGSLTFNVKNVPADGDYTLTVGYAHNDVADNNAFQTANRWSDVTVNADAASKQRVVFANTRSWNDYWTTSIRVSLRKGANTVLFDNATGYAPNLDYITVARTTEQTSGQPVPVTSVAIVGQDVHSGKLALAKGANAQLNATVAPGNATDSGVRWTSSDKSVVTVDAVGKVVAIKRGNATITATSVSDGTISDSIRVTVSDARSGAPEKDGQERKDGGTLPATGVAVAALVGAMFALALAGWIISMVARRHGRR